LTPTRDILHVLCVPLTRGTDRQVTYP